MRKLFSRNQPPPPVAGFGDSGPELSTGYPQTVTNNLVGLMESQQLEVIETLDGVVLTTRAPDHYFEGTNSRPIKLEAVDFDRNIGAELGKSYFENFAREEYNPEFRGLLGLEKYQRMRRGDAATRSALKALKTPVVGATWFIEPGGEEEEDRTIARFVNHVLNHHLTYTWEIIVREALNMLDFGYYMFEKVYDYVQFEDTQYLAYGKLSPRHPLDVIDDGWEYDENGGPVGVNLYSSPGSPDNVFIPIQKLAVFTYDGEGGDMTGLSVLRSSYKHWFFKEQAYKIDGIQKERHGIGIPIITLPINFTDRDRQLAYEIGRNLRSNEKAHVVLPPNWEILFAKLEGQPVSALETAVHHTKMIYQNILVQALWDDEGSGETTMELFYKSTREIANIITGVVNSWIIPDIVAANWPDVTEFPKMRVRKLGDTQEARTLSFALRNFIGAGAIRVDDPLEDWARQVIDAPTFDPSTERITKAPQLPGATPAKQSQASKQKIAPGNNAGRDGGGVGGGSS